MSKRKEEWSKREIIFMLTYCVLFYVLGVILLYFKELFGLGFIFVTTMFFIPVLTEAEKKVGDYLKERRKEKLRRNRETVVVGGTPQKRHKKKRHRGYVICPSIDDFVSKGKAMRELGLFYEKKRKKVFVIEKEIVEPAESSTPNRTYNQLNELFDALDYRKRIRIAHHANIGAGHHGGSIRKMVETEAKRRGVNSTVIMKGRDIIIESGK